METLNNVSTAEKKSAVLADAILESFPKTFEGKVLFYIAIAFSTFQLLTAAHIVDVPTQILRATHVGFLSLIALPLIGALKNYKIGLRYLLWFLGIIGFTVAMYQYIEYNNLIVRSGSPTANDVFFGVLALIVIFVTAWIIMGPSLPIISGFFLAYCFFGKLSSRNFSTSRLQFFSNY